MCKDTDTSMRVPRNDPACMHFVRALLSLGMLVLPEHDAGTAAGFHVLLEILKLRCITGSMCVSTCEACSYTRKREVLCT